LKVFIIGAPKSGRTTLAQDLASKLNYQYINACSWLKATFRSPHPNEHPYQFDDEYHSYFKKRLNNNPNLFQDHILEIMKVSDNNNFIIDGLISPKDFASLFDYTIDIVVFLNRTDNTNDSQDYENIAISVIRDYCFWLASANLINKSRWLEYNFKMNGPSGNLLKIMGSQNTVIIVNNFNKVLEHLPNVMSLTTNSSKLQGDIDAISQ